MNFPALRGDRKMPPGLADTKTEALIYLRVSTKDQVENFSLSTQRTACIEHCKRQGWTAVVEFEEAISAKNTDRPRFQAMLDHCKKHYPRVAAVVVYQVSRFSRNTADYTTVSKQLRDLGVRLCSVTEPFDNTSPAGMMMENLLASFAQFDNDVRRDRTITGMHAAIRAGKWVNAPPIGYLHSETAPGGLVLDPERAPMIRQAFEMYRDGYTKAEIRTKLNTAGLTMPRSGRPLSPQQVDKMLRSPVYAGWIKNAWGITARGAFQAVISDDLISSVQAKMASKPQRAAEPTRSLESADFPLRVFVKCEACGKGLTGSFATGRGGKRYAHYFCRTSGCRRVKFRRDDLHEHFIEMLYGLYPKGGGWDRLFQNVLKDVWQERHTKQERAHKANLKARAALEEKQQRLIDLLVSSAISERVYQEQVEKVGTALAALKEEDNDEGVTEQELTHLLGFAEWLLMRVAGIWNAAEQSNKQRLQRAIFPDGLLATKKGFGTSQHPLFFYSSRLLTLEASVWRPQGDSNPRYRRERAMS
jgi:site-specific DNA recombinase